MKSAPDLESRMTATVEAIYDAALDEERWTGVIPQIANITGGFAGALVRWDTAAGALPVMHHVGFADEIFTEYANHYVALDPRTEVFFQRRDIEIYSDEMLVSREVKKNHPYFHWQRSTGHHHAYGARLFHGDGFESTLVLTRSEKQGEATAADINRLGLLLLHLRRSVTLGQKLGERFSSLALDALPFGIVVVDEKNQVAFVNSAAARIAAAGDGVKIASGALTLWRDEDDAALGRVVHQYRKGLYADIAKERKRLIASRPSGRRPFVLTVAPISNRVLSLAPSLAVMICITDPYETVHLQSRSLAEIFGLSPAEAEVALALATRGSLQLAARQCRITEGSARQYMKRIFSKTNTSGQVELIALILGSVRL